MFNKRIKEVEKENKYLSRQISKLEDELNDMYRENRFWFPAGLLTSGWVSGESVSTKEVVEQIIEHLGLKLEYNKNNSKLVKKSD